MRRVRDPGEGRDQRLRHLRRRGPSDGRARVRLGDRARAGGPPRARPQFPAVRHRDHGPAHRRRPRALRDSLARARGGRHHRHPDARPRISSRRALPGRGRLHPAERESLSRAAIRPARRREVGLRRPAAARSSRREHRKLQVDLPQPRGLREHRRGGHHRGRASGRPIGRWPRTPSRRRPSDRRARRASVHHRRSSRSTPPSSETIRTLPAHDPHRMYGSDSRPASSRSRRRNPRSPKPIARRPPLHRSRDRLGRAGGDGARSRRRPGPANPVAPVARRRRGHRGGASGGRDPRGGTRA